MKELEEAELRHEAREMYNDLGAEGCIECIGEGIAFFSILMEIIMEDIREKKENQGEEMDF